ncbi:MAG TPA: selenoneine biosynthesis selenosugar synthase SenB [Gemmataceae bacterium]|nr:selenoneine biosynthesis selenosugar synthase SenB [Gemmataceae bacterium]
MKIFMACPAPAHSRKGNRVTAVRWARILKGLGHRLRIARQYDGAAYDCCIALHARRSHAAVVRFRRLYPERPLVVALTGTDLYRDIRTDSRAQESLELADRLIVLQPQGRDELPAHLRDKVQVIFQSAVPGRRPASRDDRFFRVCVLGHLREEKDPFRAALALQWIPAESKIRIIHAGEALSRAMAAEARALGKQQTRYRWLGEVPRRRAQHILARSKLLVLSSRMEGGANVVSEALVADVPVLASRIPGSEGMLGKDYPGFFPVGDTRALARLLRRAELDRDFYNTLLTWCKRLAPLFAPARERAAWAKLLREFRTAGNRRPG